MYQNSYEEIISDACGDARMRERAVLERAVRLLTDAMRRKSYSTEAIAAIYYTGKVWRALIADLATFENQLDEALRARIISVGLWVLKQCEFCRLTRSVDFEGIIEVTTTISAGLV